MRRLVISEFITMDGVMEDPGGSENFERGGWALKFQRGPEGDKFKMDELMAGDALLLGRKTYEGFAAAWPGRTGEFADKMNNMKKYVVSTTMQHGSWNNTSVINGNVTDEIAMIKAIPGEDILVAGSALLVNSLLEDNLVDVIRLMVFPTVLGLGKRLFMVGEMPHNFRLVEARPVGDEGVLTLVYEPKTG